LTTPSAFNHKITIGRQLKDHEWSNWASVVEEIPWLISRGVMHGAARGDLVSPPMNVRIKTSQDGVHINGYGLHPHAFLPLNIGLFGDALSIERDHINKEISCNTRGNPYDEAIRFALLALSHISRENVMLEPAGAYFQWAKSAKLLSSVLGARVSMPKFTTNHDQSFPSCRSRFESCLDF
jgi:hypothetical protein